MPDKRMIVAAIAVALTTACSDTIAGSPAPTTSGGRDGRAPVAGWVDAVCTGYRESFGSAPTEQELDAGDPAALKQRFLDYLDTQQRAATAASERLAALGPPDIETRGKQIQRDMIGNFDGIAGKAESERKTVAAFDPARDRYKFKLMIVSSAAMHPYGLDTVEDNEELDAAVDGSAVCKAMYDELKRLIS